MSQPIIDWKARALFAETELCRVSGLATDGDAESCDEHVPGIAEGLVQDLRRRFDAAEARVAELEQAIEQALKQAIAGQDGSAIDAQNGLTAVRLTLEGDQQ